MSTYKILETSYYIGMVLLITGIIIVLAEKTFGPYIYCIGLIPLIVIRSYNYITGNPENKRKLFILLISTLFLTIAGIAIFLNRSWWILLIAISATIDLYISFRKFN